MRDWAAELVDRARSEGVELTGDGGLLTALVRQVLQPGSPSLRTDTRLVVPATRLVLVRT